MISLFDYSLKYYSKRRSKRLTPLDEIRSKYHMKSKGRLRELIKSRIGNESIDKLDKKLLRLGIKHSAEDFLLQKYLYTIILIMLGVLFLRISTTLSSICIMLSVFMFFQPEVDLDKRLKRLNDNILKEFPRFARTLRYSPHENIIDTIGDYLSVSSGPLYFDLKILYAMLESGMGEKRALEEFSKRLNINAITNYVMAIITALEVDKEKVDTLYAIQEEKIRQMNINNTRDEMNKRPEILERINMVVIYSIMALNGLAILLSFYYDFAIKI